MFLFFLFTCGIFFIIENCKQALSIYSAQVFLFFFILFYFFKLFLQKSFLFCLKPFKYQISFFLRITTLFQIRLRLICTFIPEPSPFLVCIRVRIHIYIAHITCITSIELVIIDTRLICSKIIDLFKFLFFKIDNQYKSYMFKVYKVLLEY